LVLAFAGFVREASAARVTGSVRMPAPGAAPPSDDPSGYWRAWNGFLELRPPALDPRSEVLVVLRGGDLPEPRGCAYRLQQGDFAPKAMAVRPGATLRIENRDGCSHELTSASIPEFPPLATAPGNARAIAGVPGGGPHAITDRLYGHVGGWVHVMDDLAACATMAADGRYVFEDVPAGRYRLVVLRGETEVRSADVEVRSNGLTVDPIAIP
ncbi:MAG: hypothetical protein AAGH15_20150, partial [Myxococcota bacterium]